MFFILSKILTFLLSPFTYLVILLLWMLFTKNAVRRKKLLITSVILIFVFGNNFLLDEAVRLWEKPISKTRTQNYDIAIVLGGMIIYDVQNDISRFNSSVDRLLQALPKIKNGEIKHLLFSGGSGDIYHPENKEGILIRKYLDDSGIKIDSLLIESESRNTHENALFSRELLQTKFKDLSNKKILLITSASHMRRSLACFEKQGLSPDYLCSNRSAGPHKFELEYCFIPGAHVFSGWTHLTHEIIGYWAYKLTGKI
jgi:uncharacterized SAM-binding protein YcdF (DUF218 family)